LAGLVGLVLSGVVGAQTARQAALRQPNASRQQSDITFELLRDAAQSVSYSARQVRRFLQPDNTMVGVIEDVVQEGGGADAHFRVDFVDVEGVAPPPDLRTRWSNVYVQSASLLHEHGGYRIRQLAAARANYTLHPFNRGMRGTRSCWWLVVAPVRRDKCSWVLALDEVTGVPLYQGQIDSQGRLLAEIDVLSLQVGASPGTIWWSPAMTVTRFATPAAAIASIQSSGARQIPYRLLVPAINQVVPDYSLLFTQVTQTPLNGDRTLVLCYTDGVDEFFVLQSPNATDPFALLPVGGAGAKALGKALSDKEMAVARYDDASMRVYLFHREGVLVRIAGQGALLRLDDVARRLAQQAVTGV
jgi:hypothetical protein